MALKQMKFGATPLLEAQIRQEAKDTGEPMSRVVYRRLVDSYEAEKERVAFTIVDGKLQENEQ